MFDTHLFTLHLELSGRKGRLVCCQCLGQAEGDVTVTNEDGEEEDICSGCHLENLGEENEIE